MNHLRRFLALFRDSPTYGRDQASLLTGFTVGSIALLLNAIVLTVLLLFMLNPDDRDFEQLTRHLEFGQLLSLILLGGAASIATLVVPLRMISVFWGPRIGRYFDQIVLSGISPMRFVIGKVTSQNLFLILILFLLVPYAVLALSLGGIKPIIFLACLILVWIYCITLAMVTLWLALFLNEMLAAVIVISVTIWFAAMGCIPFPIAINPFIMTPFPALMQPVWSVVNAGGGPFLTDFWTAFLSCAACMSLMTVVAFGGIYLGPLYGIIRDNSTFGEVVKAGDATRKRWFRARQHIQRPSELAFFYENRSETLRRHEGLIRWGLYFGGLTLLLGIATTLRWHGFEYLTEELATRVADQAGMFAYSFHVVGLTIHGVAMVLAIYFFSHGRNTTFQELPFAVGRKVEVAKLDTIAFLLFTGISAAISIGLPFAFDLYAADHNGYTVFHYGPLSSHFDRELDFLRIAIEGGLILTICGICCYLMQRWLCLSSWSKIVPILIMAVLYGVLVCGSSLVPMILLEEFRELRNFPRLVDAAPNIALVSPFVVMLTLFEELPANSTIPQHPNYYAFYFVHALLIVGCLKLIRHQSWLLRRSYLVRPEDRKKSRTASADVQEPDTDAADSGEPS